MTTIVAGQTLTRVAVTSADPLVVLAGGTAILPDLASGAIATIDAGGVEIGGQVAFSATLDVYGTLTSANVVGLVNFSAGAVGNGITLDSHQPNVANGATLVDVLVAYNSYLGNAYYAFNVTGGSVTGLAVGSGGNVNITGATVQAITVETSGKTQIEGAAGVPAASGGTIAGYLSLNGSATSEAMVVVSGGTQDVFPGFASGTTLQAGGTQIIEFAGSASSTEVGSGGELLVLSGGTAQAAVIAGGGGEIVFSGGVDSGATVASGGLLVVAAGGTAIAPDILAGGTEVSALVIEQGPQATSGWVSVASGVAVASSELLTVFAGGTLLTAAVYGSALVNTGGTAEGVAVQSGGTLVLNDAATVTGATVASAGTLVVSAGTFGGGVVGPGGNEIIDFQATLDGGLISGGSLVVQGFASANAPTIEAGGFALLSSQATVVAPMVGAGGVLTLGLGATLSGGGTIGSGGVLDDNGNASGVLVQGGGTLLVDGSFGFFGTADATDLRSGAVALVRSGATLSNTTVEAGATVWLEPGATFSAAGSVAGTVETVDVALANPTGIAGWVSFAPAPYVASGGQLDVFTGGTVSGATIAAGGSPVIAGGTALATVLLASPSPSLFGGGGNMTLVSGVVSGTQLGPDTQLFVSGGTAYASTVDLFGQVYVSAGGTADGVTVGAGAAVDVQSGGVAENVTLAQNLAGLNLYAGGTLLGTVDVAAGGLAQISIEGTVMPAATFENFGGGGDSIDLTAISYDPAGSVTYAAGTLEVVAGGTTYALHVAQNPVLANGTFSASSDGGGGTGITFLTSGSRIVSSGGSASNVVTGAGQELVVSAGGTVTGALLSGTGPLLNYTPSTIDGGALAFANSGTVGLDFMRGTISGATVENGGNFFALGDVTGATIGAGGLIFAFGGNIAGATLQTSGMVLELAGTTQGLVNSGGVEGLALSGTSISGQVTSGGEQVVGGHLADGGALLPLPGGIAQAATVGAGGMQFVNDGGLASASKVETGGRMVVNSGGTADLPLIDGGTLTLNQGASVGTVVFGAGGELVVASGAGLPAAVRGFAPGDSIDLAGLGAGGSVTLDPQTEILTVNAGTQSLAIQLAAPAPGVAYQVTNGVVTACFRAGTRIATAGGALPVEALVPGMMVATASGGLAAVRWVGRRVLEASLHPRPHDVLPVRIAAGAFAPGVPARALDLSPDHAVLAGGVLIPVRYLVNGATIRQVAAGRVSYFHLELARHDAVLAEGLACETYLDTGNRDAFEGGEALILHPDFARPHALAADAARRVWEAAGCAPLVLEGRPVAALRARLLARAGLLGHGLAQPVPQLRVGEGLVAPARIEGIRHRYVFDTPPQRLRLVGGGAIPAEVGVAAKDTRRLGAMLTSVRVRVAGVWRRIPLAALGEDGLYDVERRGRRAWRWTDGDAALALPAALLAGATAIEIGIPAVQPVWDAALGVGGIAEAGSGAAGGTGLDPGHSLTG